MEYGGIFTSADAERALKEANRDYYGRKTWEQAFGNIDLAEQQQLGSLQYDYSKAIGEAYAAAHKNQQNIMSSNLGQGYKEQAMLSNDEALSQAFETYRQKYLSGVSSVEKQANTSRTELSEQMTEQAENTAAVLNSIFGTDKEKGYIQWLYENMGEDKFANNLTFDRYMKNETDEAGNLTGKKVLKDPNELRKLLYDEQGNLTKEATNIYDQMFNLGAETGDYSYYRWLAENNEDLYKWTQNKNAYDFTAAGTNMGTIKKLVGMKSNDEIYDYVDKVAGLSKDSLKQLTDKFAESAAKVSDLLSDGRASFGGTTKGYKYSYDKIEKGLNETLNDVKTLVDELGISEYFNKIENINLDEKFNKIKTAMTNTLKDIDKSGKDAAKSMFDIDFNEILTVTTTGAAIGTASGPGLGTVAGAFIAGTADFFTQLFSNIIDEPGAAKRTSQSRQSLSEMYNEYMVYLTNLINETK